MRKKSPKLIIASVNGNFGLFSIISLSAMWFSQIEKQFIICYFNDNNYTPGTIDPGDVCMLDEKNDNMWIVRSLSCLSILSVTFFEYMAICPYFLRSLRIKKMF